MIILNFDSEGTTYCPMNEIATVAECIDCLYHHLIFDGRVKQSSCRYEDFHPDPMGAVEE